MCRLKIYLFLQLVNLCYSGLCMPCINQLLTSFQKAAGCFPVQHCRGQNVMKPRDTAFTDFFFLLLIEKHCGYEELKSRKQKQSECTILDNLLYVPYCIL